MQGFSRIAILLIFLLKTIESSESALKAFRVDNNKVFDSDGSRANETVINSSRKLMYIPNIRTMKNLTP